MEGYKRIPGFSKYMVDENGSAYSEVSQAFLFGAINNSGYCFYRIKNDEGKTVTLGAHRAVALAFIETDDPENKVVNHINGIKLDNRVSNLEWVTYQENAYHAGDNCLTSKCIPVLVKTNFDEVLKFPSILACAEAFKLTKDAVVWRLKSKGSRLFPEGNRYLAANEGIDWPDDVDDKYGRSKPIVVRNVMDGQTFELADQKRTAEFLMVSQSTVTKWMKMDQPVVAGFWQLKLQGQSWREIEDLYMEIQKSMGWKIVIVFNEEEKKIYFSSVTCAKERNLNTTALNYRLKSNGKVKFSDGFRYCFYSEYLKGPLQ